MSDTTLQKPVLLRSNSFRTFCLRVWNSPTLATWFSFIARSFSLVVVLPWGLRQLSASEALVWQLFVTINSIQLLLDLGFTATFARLFAFALGGADNFSRQRLGVQSGAKNEPNWTACESIWAIQTRVYRILTAFASLGMATFGTWYIAGPIRNLPHPWTGWVAWLAVMSSTLASFQAMSYSSWLLGMNAVGELRRAEALFALGSMVTSVLVLAFGGELLALVLGTSVWIWLGLVRNRWLAIRIRSGRLATFRVSGFNSEIWRSIWPQAWRSGIGVVLGGGLVQGTGLIAARIAGPTNEAAATAFLITLRLATTVSQFAQAPFVSKLPALATMRSKGNREALLGLARRGVLLSHWVFVLGAISVAVGMPFVLKIADASIPAISPQIWWAFCLALFIERFGAMNLQIYSTSNHIVWHKANGGAALIMIPAGLLLVPRLGLLGLPLAILAGYLLFYSIYSSRFMYRDLDLQPLSWERTLVLPPLLCLIAAGAIDLLR